jgi:hypothetical protein
VNQHSLNVAGNEDYLLKVFFIPHSKGMQKLPFRHIEVVFLLRKQFAFGSQIAAGFILTSGATLCKYWA